LGACDKLKEASTKVWRYFFPKKIDPPECVLELLRYIYPTVNWDRVFFYDGWPHLIGLSPNAAITLPDTYSPHRINIYFKPGRWDPCTCRGLGLIVHEGFHVLQITDVIGGIGPGFARPFIIQYLSCWAGHGFTYDDHPLEQTAYLVAGRSTSLYETCCDSPRLPCDCSTDPPTLNQAGLQAFKDHCSNVVQQDSGINFWRDMADCTPGLKAIFDAARRLFDRTCRTRIEVSVPIPTGPGSGPTDPEAPVPPRTHLPERTSGPPIQVPVQWIACLLGLVGAGLLYLIGALYYLLWMLVWTIVAIVLWLVKIIVEIIGTIVAGIMWAVTGIVCAAEWLWGKFKALLGKICTWSEELEKKCTDWEEKQEQKCTQTKEEKEKKCTQTKEEKEKKCTQTKEEKTKNCCTWWPCSWACKSWHWVVNVVCVAWTWVTHVVCVAWTWITHVVCVAWTWVVSKTCKTFTWVVKGLTCW
jgi:hypothetical protein